MKKKLEGKSGAVVSRLTNTVSSTKFIVTVAILITVGTFSAWQYHNTTNSERVFWGMVDDSLQTSAYTRQTQQKSGSQSVDQIFQTATKPQHTLFSETIFTQTGVDSATAVTENIGTPTADYVRYTSIQTAKKLDFSSILNVWGITEAPKTSTNTEPVTNAQLYNQAVLGIIPVGDLSAAQRREVMKILKDNNAYSYTVTETKRSLPFGRPTYTMQVVVNPVGYIAGLKQFAAYVGLNHLEKVNPDEYAQAEKLSFIVKVDGWTHQMVATDQNQGAKTEVISGRNLRKQLPDEPSDTISVDVLQSKLQSIE